MAHRIEIIPTVADARAGVRKRHLESMGFAGKVHDVQLVDVYTIDAALQRPELAHVATMLADAVTEHPAIDVALAPRHFDWAIEIGYRPGVTDNVAATAREGLEDLLKTKLREDEGIHSSQVMFLKGDLSPDDARVIAGNLSNPLIQRVHIKDYHQFQAEHGMGIVVPKVILAEHPSVDSVDLLHMPDEALAVLGKKGIANADGTRRGPLALDSTYMKAIKAYFQRLGRNPTDVEVESIAQTWSEHCKHTIFADSLDELTDGLFRTHIKGATERIRQARGVRDFCVSVFKDNSGAITFDDAWLLTDKVETHNSPSALDAFSGAITGIVGVNRDTIGFGLGAKPVINRYGFCFADPRDEDPLYKGEHLTQRMLSPRRIMDGVIKGVNAGGNCSGIPTHPGFLVFDQRHKGKPLVFVGTIGIIPRESAGRPSYEKQAQAGDYIVMVGGRVGKDGIHGATFSSEAMDAGSPATAVQIGDPITQKKLSDALVKEARDLGLYTSITDNGAGGLSCSVAEMAQESGGCHVDLDKVPLKYHGLAPWEIWISESQERMTLAVPPENWDRFRELMERRGVEATVIGEFTNSGKCVVDHKQQRVMDVEMNFLHHGLPPRPLQSTYTKIVHEEPVLQPLEDLTKVFHGMLGRLNIASFSFITEQYDHEVQGGSVIKPLQGRGRVNGDATVTRPLLHSPKGVVVSQGINPSYSDIDTYHMAASAIDTAIRNAIAAGADLEHLALLDNFCWCSSDDPERLGQLKEAVRACYDYAVAFGTPWISGKDSMFNDFKGYDKDGKPVKISVPPTLLVSSLGIMQDAQKAVSLDAKLAGDLVYVLGETHEELGGSEYFAMMGELTRGQRYIGNDVPQVDAQRNKQLYSALAQCIDEGLVASAQSVHRGGLGVALVKTALGGKLGMDISLEQLPRTVARDDFALFSESQGRLVVTVAPRDKTLFEQKMQGNVFAQVGKITGDGTFRICGVDGKTILNTPITTMENAYTSTFRGY